MEEAYITMPKGFKAAGVSAGMKCTDPANINKDDPKSSYLDMALIVSDLPANAAGVYTSNLVKGHSLTRTIDIINSGAPVRGIVINSKVANAGVGPAGVEDAEAVASAIAERLGCESRQIMTASTGVIGARLPLDKMTKAVPNLVDSLSAEEESAHNSEFAMMTTDTVPKEVAATITMGDGKEVTIAAQAKGSGMIHPNLATMICVFTTDAAISSALIDKALRNAVKYTFNRVSVDGDTSVCVHHAHHAGAAAVGVGHLASCGNGGCASVDGVHAVGGHVVGQTAGTADTANHCNVFWSYANFGHSLME